MITKHPLIELIEEVPPFFFFFEKRYVLTHNCDFLKNKKTKTSLSSHFSGHTYVQHLYDKLINK